MGRESYLIMPSGNALAPPGSSTTALASPGSNAALESSASPRHVRSRLGGHARTASADLDRER